MSYAHNLQVPPKQGLILTITLSFMAFYECGHWNICPKRGIESWINIYTSLNGILWIWASLLYGWILLIWCKTRFNQSCIWALKFVPKQGLSPKPTFTPSISPRHFIYKIIWPLICSDLILTGIALTYLDWFYRKSPCTRPSRLPQSSGCCG